MGELERLRDAHEFRVSRSHVTAAVTFAVLLSSVTFGIGFVVGRAQGASAEEGGLVSIVDGVPSKSLVELLAEVDRVKLLHASQRLTYPEVLNAGAVPELPSGTPDDPAPVEVTIPAAAPATAGAADPVPPGPFVVRVATFDAEADALALRDALRSGGHAGWANVRIVAGTPEWIVGVGSFATEADATPAAMTVAEAVAAIPGLVAAPRVSPVDAL